MVAMIILILVIIFCLIFRPLKGKIGEKTISGKLFCIPKTSKNTNAYNI